MYSPKIGKLEHVLFFKNKSESKEFQFYMFYGINDCPDMNIYVHMLYYDTV